LGGQPSDDGRAAARRDCRPGPHGVWAVAPAVSTPHRLRGTRQDLPCTSAGNPAPRVRAISGPLDPVTSGSPRSSPDTSPKQVRLHGSLDRSDSQADSSTTRRRMSGVSPRCPRTAINSRHPPLAAAWNPELAPGSEPASNAQEHARNA
jgi:hypothetical protein